jgi:hypothetical protein
MVNVDIGWQAAADSNSPLGSGDGSAGSLGGGYTSFRHHVVSRVKVLAVLLGLGISGTTITGHEYDYGRASGRNVE